MEPPEMEPTAPLRRYNPVGFIFKWRKMLLFSKKITYYYCHFLFTFCIFRPSSLLRSSITGLLSPIHEPSDFDEYMEDIGKNKNMLCSIIFII